MEEIGAQVAPRIFIGGGCSDPLTRKRGFPVAGTNFQRHNIITESEFQNPPGNWNPKVWNWDSSRFVAKPINSDIHRGISGGGTASLVAEPPSRRSSDEEERSPSKSTGNNHPGGEDNGSLLRLNLGRGEFLNPIEEEESASFSARPNKKIRSGVPGGNYPVCQVDNCNEDLSNAKDYHKRHKVCDVHSKATQALVGKQMQRFCQQCSRFHPRSEFDEGKRSCRRRLAGHNRRRRKSQPQDATSRPMRPGICDDTSSEEMDIVNLLSVLAGAQRGKDEKSSTFASAPNKDQLIQILNKINLLPLPTDVTAKLPNLGCLQKKAGDHVFSENQPMLSGKNSSASTKDLLAVLSTTLAAPAAPDALQRRSQEHDTEETNFRTISSGGKFRVCGERSGMNSQSLAGNTACPVPERHAGLPLQLFSSSPENEGLPKLASGRKYFSSDSSNSMEERSPSSSPPTAQKLFPVKTSKETAIPESILTSGGVNVNATRTRGGHGITSLRLFGGSNEGAKNDAMQSFPYQAGYTSSSGSDHSHSSLNSDAQDRTGRIIFKLFDKDPGDLPGTLRTQVYNWLSRGPSEMESYIRPGCVVLSIYMSMPYSLWEHLEANLLHYVNSLVQHSDTEFWRTGRFLVHTGRRLAVHKDGKVHLFKSSRAWSSPELVSISPLAVVGGQETSLILRGRNLSNPGSKIHCTHSNGYTIEELPGPASRETLYEEITLSCFTTTSGELGRCFIEIENGLRGTSFPVLIADAAVCQELKLLEPEFNESIKAQNAVSQPREELLHFLNTLGWVFQRKGISSMDEAPLSFTLNRFKFLILFSVERDFCSLVKTLLDILLERKVGSKKDKSVEMLQEILILNKAVNRRCKKMVDMLVRYSIPDTATTDDNNDDITSSQKYIFPPNLAGPGGVTPLHLAACTAYCDDMVDALTSDPLGIGLVSWSSVVDANGLSPHAYALMRNNHSYNNIVAQKLAGQICVSIGLEIEQQQQHQSLSGGGTVDELERSQLKKRPTSCSKCAISVGTRARYNSRIPGSQGLLRRPYINSMLAIAAVCVCVCLFLRGSPDIGLVAPFKWENLGYGFI